MGGQTGFLSVALMESTELGFLAILGDSIN